MSENKYKATILSIILVWNLFVFIRLAHVSWIPGFMGAWFVDKGLLIYKDFLQTHFPFAQFFLLPFLKITNWNLEAEPIIALWISVITSYVLYKIGEKYLSKIGNVLSLMFFNALFWYFCTWVQFSEEMLVGLLIIVVLGKLLKNNLNKREVFVAGILTSSSILFGQIVAPTAVLIFCIIGLLNRKRLTNLFLGVCIPFLLTIVYFLLQGGLYDFYFWNTEYYVLYSSLSSQKGGVLPWNEILMFYAPLGMLAVYILISRKNLREVLLTAGILASSIPTVTLSIFHPHHYLFVLPVAAFGFGLIWTVNKKLGFILFVVFVVFCQTTLAPWYISRLQPKKEISNLSNLTNDTYQLETLLWLEKNSTSDEKILVMGDPMFYFRADRLPANKYFSALPWHYLPIEKTTLEFEKAKPEIWIVDKLWSERLINGWKRPEVDEFIKSEIANGYKLEFENKYWQVWRLIN